MATQIVQPCNQEDGLTVTVREMSTLTVVVLAGELDLATAGILREKLVLLDLDDGINLEVDLRALHFLGSTGIGVLIAACKRVRAGGGSFIAVCNDDFSRRTLEISGLVDYLELREGEGVHPKQRGATS